jgi:hypothetical protein
MQQHFDLCKQNKEQRIVVPEPGEFITFTKWMHKFEVPIIGFYDFESVMTTPNSPCLSCDAADMGQCYHKSSVESVQEAGTFSITIVNFFRDVLYAQTYSGDDAAEVFLDTLLNIPPALMEKLHANEPMEMRPEDIRDFVSAVECHICENAFRRDDVRVRDHCHLTGKYKGAAHQSCNLQRTESKRIPLFCHNFSGYDSHLILNALKPDPRIVAMKALPRNTEKFRVLEINYYTFLDSLSFLEGSLADLVDDLVRSGHDFPLIDQAGLCKTPEEKQLLLQKGVYPYEFAKSVQQLRDAKSLPEHANFYSSVANGNITAAEYGHAQRVYETFGCTDMLHYT